MLNFNRNLVLTVLTTALVAAAGTTLAAVGTTAKPDPRMQTGYARMGVNLEGLSDWSRSEMFVDLMRTSRGWGPLKAPWESTNMPRLDAFGWPLEDAAIIIFATTGSEAEEPVPHPGLAAGVYKLSFNGTATVTEMLNQKEFQVKNLKFNSKTNRTTGEIHVLKATRNSLMLRFTNTKGGVKNVKLIRPGYRENQVFTREFLKALEPFSTIRFMDYFNTNSSELKTWRDRATPRHATYTSNKHGGGSLEHAILLGNLTGKDIWINIPLEANDDYIRKTAMLLKRDLRPNVNVYVEFSNELWNWSFPNTARNRDLGVQEVVKGDTTLTLGEKCTQAMFDNRDEKCNSGWVALHRVAKRTVEISKIFAGVFGQNQINKRVRVVFASQFEYKDLGEGQLRFMKTVYQEPKKFIYGIAGAPYLALNDVSTQEGLTNDKIFETFNKQLRTHFFPDLFDEGSNVKGVFKRKAPYTGDAWTSPSQLALARYYGIKSLAYEAGVDYAQNDKNLGAKYISAIQDPRTGTLTRDMYGQWVGCGNDLMMYFTLTSGYGRFGYWGLTNNVKNLDTPRYRAVKEISKMPLGSGLLATCQ